MYRRSTRARRIYTCRSSREKLPHRSALALYRRPCRWVASTVLMFGVARKLTLRASGGSEKLSSYTQTQRSCYARARRIYASVAAAARSCLIDVHFTFVVDHAEGRINRAHVRCYEEADLASLG